MTIAEAERFYSKDKKEYILENNYDFISWLDNSIRNGYHCYIKIESLQTLIDTIVNWYEIKYPERELEFYEGVRFLNFEDIKSISHSMDINQLFFRLPHKHLCLMECGYRSHGGGQYPIYEKGKLIGWKSHIFMNIKRKNVTKDDWLYNWSDMPYFLLSADKMTGEVFIDHELEKYTVEKGISLEEVLELFENEYSDTLDFKELNECIYDHTCDLELRHRILELVALKLLYSKNTIPERGFERANRFINEFNKKLGLTLSNEEINEIMNSDYTNGEKCGIVTRKDKDIFGDEINYVTIENVTKNEKQGIKTLIKRYLSKNKS